MEHFKQYGKRIATGILPALFFAYMVCMPVYATETGTITELAAHVYQNADTDSNIVANVIMGYNFPILAEEADEAGNIWYLIETDMGVQGYIPAQSVFRIGTETHEENTHEENAQPQSQEPVPENENEDENNLPDSVQKQLLTMQVVNIRENPSTNGEVLGQIPSGITLDHIDVITNPMGEVWYEISYEDVHGFIRQSTVMEVETPTQETGVQPYAVSTPNGNIDIDMLMEIARLYQDESRTKEPAAESDALEKPQMQEQEIYDAGSMIGENAEGTKRKRISLHPDMVIILSLMGIILCAAIISRTLKRLVRLYR